MDKLNEIIDKYKETRGALIPVLQEAQKASGYLSKDVLIRIAKGLSLPLSQVYGVATFYAQFYLTPHGQHTIRACRGTACHVRGAKKVISTIEETTGLSENQTSDDLKFTFETVACLGACALAPVMMVDKDYFGKMTPKRVATILSQYGEK